MPNYKMVDADVLDGAMLATAEAIRAKGGTEAPIPWDKTTGYKDAIDAITAGGGLNFEVVGGTVKPANPAENTLWVNTQTEITGWVFSADQPSAPISGLVWFDVSDNSSLEFNAVAGNTLNVYPSECSQYNGSYWSPVDMMLYQDSEWKENKNWIIQNGALKYAGTVGETINNGSHYKNGDAYVVKTNGNEYYAVYFGPISLTSSSEIVVELLGSMSYADSTNHPALIVSKEPPEYDSKSGIKVTAVAKVIFTNTSAENFYGIKRLTGSFDGEYYLTLTVAGTSSIPNNPSGYLKIKDFYVGKTG